MPLRRREILGALALVAIADIALFHGDGPAIGGYAAAIFFGAVPTLLLAIARARRVSLRLAAILGMFGFVAARCAFAPTPGTIALGFLMVFGVAIAMRGRTSFLTDVAGSFGATFTTIPQRLEAAFGGMKKHFGATQSARSLPAIVVPLALVLVFVGIFGLANPLVGKWLKGIGGLVTVPDGGRIVVWIASLFGALLLVRPAVWRSKAREDAETATEMTDSAFSIARNALVPLNLVFFGYNALDAAYLWAGSPPPGVSEQAYAHQGVAWLTVALALLTLIVGIMFRGALAHDARAKLARTLAFAWLGQGVVLALGTFRRMSIHIGTSGLSNIRFLGITGILLVVAGLLLVGLKLHQKKSFAWLLRRQLDALVLAALGFSLFPTHLVSARVNVGRVMVHDYQALVHIEEQAVESESAAALLPILDHDDERIRRGMAALLLNERDALRKAASTRKSWRDRDIASGRTLKALEEASPKLEAVLGDVERADAIIPFEYIRNSSIEGEIAQSEIDKVKPALTRSEKVIERWAAAHTARGGGTSIFEEVYARDTVVIDGKAYPRFEAIGAKDAYSLHAPLTDSFEIASPIALRPLPNMDNLERVEAKVPLRRGTTRTEATLVLERRTQSDAWRIVEERGVGAMRFYVNP